MKVELLDVMRSVYGTLEEDETLIMIRIKGSEDDLEHTFNHVVDQINDGNCAGHDSDDDSDYSFELAEKRWKYNFDQPFGKLDTIFQDRIDFEKGYEEAEDKMKYVASYIYPSK